MLISIPVAVITVAELTPIIVNQGGRQLTVSQARAIRGLKKQIRVHKKRLKNYKKDPFANDNKGHLRRNSPEVQKRIMKSRTHKLKEQIRTFKKDIKAIRQGTKDVLEK